MKIAMVAEHGNRTHGIGRVDRFSECAYVAQLARALANRGHHVDIYNFRDEQYDPHEVWLGPGVVMHNVAAGSNRLGNRDSFAYLPGFSRALRSAWGIRKPDVVHAHKWVSAVVSIEVAGSLGIPVAVTFHSLGAVEIRQLTSQACPPVRLDAERCLARTADLILASGVQEAADLVAMGAPARRVEVVSAEISDSWQELAHRTEAAYARILAQTCD